MAKHIALLMGGWSAEREVSLASGKGVGEALQKLGYKVTAIDVKPDIAEVLQKVKPDIAFNALHGRFGEDGCIQGVLEILKIPYTHSGLMASAIAMDKPMAKNVFAGVGLRCAEGRVVSKDEMLAHAKKNEDVMPRPYVVKPINEGSSVGVKIVQENENFFFTEESWSFGDAVLVEKYIPGREIQVAVMDGIDENGRAAGATALGAIEIKPKGRFYDYEAKYTDGKAVHLMPAPIEQKAYDEVMELTLKTHRALGCRGLTRSDFRYDDTAMHQEGGEPGRFYLLEVNTQPGMTPLSLSPEIAAHAGISYEQLVDRLVKGARLGA